jgi:hypothetical protein
MKILKAISSLAEDICTDLIRRRENHQPTATAPQSVSSSPIVC